MPNRRNGEISALLEMGMLILLYSKLGRFLPSSYDLKQKVCIKCFYFFFAKRYLEGIFFLAVAL